MALTKVKFENFTAFKDLEVEFSPGINALIGENGTGKTHLMKVCYAACEVSTTGGSFEDKLLRVFLPSGNRSNRLVRQAREETQGTAQVHCGERRLNATFSTMEIFAGMVIISDVPPWAGSPIRSVYVPPKDMLANAPGFRSLYELREIHFEEFCYDILQRADLPALREPIDDTHLRMLDSLESVIGGRVVVKGEEFFLSNEQGDLEFTLLAEGWRKLGLLWLLIQNGTLQSGSVLFWDEPETNLNPKMFKVVIEVLLELQRAGVQVFFATHDYVILKELDLQMTEEDEVAFHSLYRNESGEIACRTTHHYLDIRPNAIDEKFTDLYDREIMRSFGGSLL
jgi:predicted ATPase